MDIGLLLRPNRLNESALHQPWIAVVHYQPAARLGEQYLFAGRQVQFTRLPFNYA
jgi:hypothetical protein